MRRSRSFLVAGVTALTWLGCSGDTSGPGTLDPDEMILSNPVAPTIAPGLGAFTGSGASTLTFVSLPPGTLPDAEFVIIRNVTAGDEQGVTAPMLDGGFDPVALRADAGDRVELELHDGGLVLGRKSGTVPSRRPPVVVRTSPPRGRTDVALAVRPTVVFSEPVDPATLDAVRLLQGGNEVEGQAVALPTEPWVVELIPTTVLEAETEYEIDVAQGVTDLDGDALAAAVRSAFTTGTLAPPPPPPPGPTAEGRVAFVSTRHGGPWIYLANADGSDVTPLVSGEAPAWSQDGQMLAFNRGYELRIINADGTGQRVVAAGAYEPSWSPDGTRLAYHTGAWGAIRLVSADGTGDVAILIPEALGPDYLSVGQPAWSPDGQSIAFSAHWYADDGVPEIWVMNSDGSNPRMIEGTGPGADPYSANGSDPSWSPDGTRIAFVPKRWLGGPFAFLVASRLADGTGDLTVHFTSMPGGMMPSPVGDLDWSPDGQSIAFERWSATEAFPHRIRVVDTGSGISAQLIAEAAGTGLVQPYTDSDVAWSRVSQ